MYDANKETDTLLLEIPLPDRSFPPIEHCGVDQAHITLGVMTCPSVCPKAKITSMKEKNTKFD